MFWIAERERTKDETMNRAGFIEFYRCNFQRGKYFLNRMVGSDSDATGPENEQSEVIIESEELMVEIDDIVAFVGFPIFRLFR